eukprot:2144693-Rhodomonas_salina.1
MSHVGTHPVTLPTVRSSKTAAPPSKVCCVVPPGTAASPSRGMLPSTSEKATAFEYKSTCEHHSAQRPHAHQGRDKARHDPQTLTANYNH